MDITAIIKEHLPELPEGVTISEKALKAIEKEIKAQQGLEFVSKAQYAKKTEKADELEAEVKELQGKLADGETYRQKYDEEVKAHGETKKSKQKEFDDYKSSVETEKTAAAKQAAVRKQLQADGAKSTLLPLLEKEFDLTKIELDGDKIKDWDSLSKAVKEQYADVFGVIVTEGINPPAPPANGENQPLDLFVKGFDGK